MNSIKTITIENQVRPIALRRTSIKVTKQHSSPEELSCKSLRPELVRNNTATSCKSQFNQATSICIGPRTEQNPSNLNDQGNNQVRLLISKCNANKDNTKYSDSTTTTTHQCGDIYCGVEFDKSTNTSKDSQLAKQIEEFKSSIDTKDCDNTRCHRFESLSYRIVETLLQRVHILETDLEKLKAMSSASKSLQPPKSHQRLEEGQVNKLLAILAEKERQIDDLEKSNEEQRRLRVQDASQVEEKAARIKDWVSNKLKELERQNKQLRDDKKKQKDMIDSLSEQVATLTPLSTPKRTAKPLGGGVSELVRISNKLREISVSPTNVGDLDKLQKSRRHIIKRDGDQEESRRRPSASDSSGCGGNSNSSATSRCGARPDSPVYDSVGADLLARRTKLDNNITSIQPDQNNRIYDELPASQINSISDVPPPLPLHQSDRWELELYNLADENFSSLIKTSQGSEQIGPIMASLPSTGTNRRLDSSNSDQRHDSLSGSVSVSDKDAISRKSSTSLKNEILALVRPSFTTIDGDEVVDGQTTATADDGSHQDLSLEELSSTGHHAEPVSLPPIPANQTNRMGPALNTPLRGLRKNTICGSNDNMASFESPTRVVRGGFVAKPDTILRTQSVRRLPAPEKLYDFVADDLVKRGQLVKSGALKNHTRWFVLKNFHLCSYKCEADETLKAMPNLKLKLRHSDHVTSTGQSGDTSFGFKLIQQDKSQLQLYANTAVSRDEWVRILTVAINMSDLEPEAGVTRISGGPSQHEGVLQVTRQGHSKRCHATLVKHVVFFLKSFSDPSPVGYVSVKGARIREITDNHHHVDNTTDTSDGNQIRNQSYIDLERGLAKCSSHSGQNCSLAIYPRYSLLTDPVYITLGSQRDTDKWFHHLSFASGLDQSYGTEFEQTLTRIMIRSSVLGSPLDPFVHNQLDLCPWLDQRVMLYCEKPISKPLTSLQNETLRVEAIELSKSVLLFTQVPIEPTAIDYHVCLLQNCFGRFLKYPELRNELFAQLVKQTSYVLHRCSGESTHLVPDHTTKSPLGSSDSDNYSPAATRRSSLSSGLQSGLSRSPSESESCQLVTDMDLLNLIELNYKAARSREAPANMVPCHNNNNQQITTRLELTTPPSQTELIQAMQILAIAVSLDLPRGRMRWWLSDHLDKFANPSTCLGKYALYTLRAIERAAKNGPRDNVPSRMELISILLRNPYDHSSPHSLPVTFADGTYMVVDADGSTTVDELMSSISKDVKIRPSIESDFYLFSDEPSGSQELHILEPQRKVLDIVGWWEQSFRRLNSGRYQNTKAIRLICKKRLMLRAEPEETHQERLYIVHQLHQEVVSNKIPLGESLATELAAIMGQLTFGSLDNDKSGELQKCIIDKATNQFLNQREQKSPADRRKLEESLVSRWRKMDTKSAQDCVRVYLNCMRRLESCTDSIIPATFSNLIK